MKTEVIFVIDGSGSMAGKAEDVRGGFNTYVEELRKDEKGDYSLSAIVFNTQVFPLFTQKELKDVPELTAKNYAPGGNTALYDAIGGAIDEIKDSTANYCTHCGEKRAASAKFCSKCGTQLGNGRSKYLLVIMTDGEENSSIRYRKHHIVEKIKSKEAQGNWTIAYLGANQDGMREGAALGTQLGNAMTYQVHDTKTYYSKLASATAGLASSPFFGVSNFAGVTATATSDGLTQNFVGTTADDIHIDNSVAVKIKKEAAKSK